MAYRAKQHLESCGIPLSALVERFGRSKTTWSRFLDGDREPKSGDPRAEIETILREWEEQVPPDLWQLEGAAGPAQPQDESVTEPEEITMQGQALSEHARLHFKLFANPFDPEAILDPSGGDRLNDLHLPVSHKFVEARLVQALTKAGFVALAGEPGSGKSTLLERALRQANDVRPVIRVTPANVERRKMTAHHVAAEVIRQLSENPVPRTANTRDALAQEVLAQRYEQGQRVALVIDEAHELPTATLKDLKRFHELSHGFARLLAIVLVGQSELARRFELDRNFQLREVIIRCQLIQLEPMRGEVGQYLAKRLSWVGREVEEVFEPSGIQALEARLAVHDQQLPVMIGNAATAAMNIAARRGNERVTEDDVEDVWKATPESLSKMGLDLG